MTVELTDLQRRILRMVEDGRKFYDVVDELGVPKRVVKRAVTDMGRELQVPLHRMPARARELGIDL